MQQVYIGTTNYGRHWLDAPAAAAWGRMVADGCPPEGITDAGRTDAEQIAVFLKYFTTDYATSAKVDRRVWQGRTYWRRPGKPSAATPGSLQARHTFGHALDLNGATKAWVRANGLRYGWVKDIVRGEDWHMEYQAHRDVVLVSNPGAGTGSVPTAPDVTAPDPIAPKEFTVDQEARDAFHDLKVRDDQRRAQLTEGFGNLALYAEGLKAASADIRAAVQVATDNAYSGAQIGTRVLNAVTDPERGLAVQLARLSAEVAALRASGAGVTGVDIQTVADTAAREALGDLAKALTDTAEGDVQ